MVMNIASPTPDRSPLRTIARRAVIEAANLPVPGRCSLYVSNCEPALDEVMDDPMIRRLMARDGVAEDSLLSLIEQVRGHLR